MSVTELVKAREELVEKMTQIDEILGQAVQAVGAVQQSAYKPIVGTLPPAFNSNPFREQGGRPMAAQVAISQEQPRVTPPAANAPDQSTAFSIFDAETYNAQVEAGIVTPEGQQNYLVDTPGRPVSAPSPVGVEPIKPLLEAPISDSEIDADEMADLMSEVAEGLKNVKSTTTTDED